MSRYQEDLTKQDQTALRAASLRNVLQKTDRILGQSEVTVHTQTVEVSGMNFPAWTDGRKIVLTKDFKPLDEALANGFTPKTMLLATALNYHELAHVMFTPRLRSEFFDRVRSHNLMMAANILEDQAAETRFVSLYEPARHYFTALVTNYMMNDETALASNYMLVSGRLFIPERFRDQLKERFSRPKLLPKIDNIVTQYKSLEYPKDQEEMFQLVKNFQKLLDQIQPPTQTSSHGTLTEGTPSGLEKVKGLDEYVDGSKTETSGTSKDADQEDADGDAGDDDQEKEDQEERPERSAQGGSDREGGRSEQTPEDRDADLQETLEEAMDRSIGEVEEELNDRIEAVQQEQSDYKVDVDQRNFKTLPAATSLNQIIDQCVEEFRRVQQINAPGWHRQQRTGKLDPRHFVRAIRGAETVHKKWRQGVHNAMDFEIVFLLDRSGSMQASEKYKSASAALWVLKRTFEECEGVVTVLGFDSELALLSQRGELAERGRYPLYNPGGSTYVAEALREGRRVLTASTKPLKLCVCITDGAFSDVNDANIQIKGFNTNQIAFVGIKTNSVDRWTDHRSVVLSQTIDEPAELVDVVKNLALRLADERLNVEGQA